MQQFSLYATYRTPKGKPSHRATVRGGDDVESAVASMRRMLETQGCQSIEITVMGTI